MGVEEIAVSSTAFAYVSQPVRRREDIRLLTGNGKYVEGIGESGSIGAPPTIVHAVLDALAPLGVEHLDMPMTPPMIWAAIQRACEAVR